MTRQSFTTTYSGLSKVLNVAVKISPGTSHKRLSRLIVPQKSWISLWDTGATCSVITKPVVDTLQLKPISMVKAHTPQGTYDAYMYYVNLFLPNHVVLPKLLVMEGKPAGCDILIGMDVIGIGDFAVSNHNGITSFSYRYPSCGRLDFNKS